MRIIISNNKNTIEPEKKKINLKLNINIIPNMISHVSQIKYLDLSYNKIENIIGLNNLIHLKYLNLSYNNIEEIP